MIIAETKRLRLRLLERDDLDALLKIWGDAETMMYCGGAGSRDQEAGSLDYYIRQQEEMGFSTYAVELKENGELIGVCGFNPPGEGSDAEIMYHFNKSYWGKGYANEAVEKTLEYARESLDISKVGALVHEENKASAAILKNNGFQFCGMKWCDATKRMEEHYQLVLKGDQ